MAAPKRRLPAHTFIPPELIPTYLQDCQRAFKAGDVWRAWEACFLATRYRHNGLPMPEWVLAYLEQAAGALTMLSLDVTPRPPGPSLHAAVTRALGLTADGRGTPRSRRYGAERAAALAVDVALLLPKAGGKEHAAYTAVAKFHRVGLTTVRDAYKVALARRDRLDGRVTLALQRDMADTLQAGSIVPWEQYPKGPLRTLIVESLQPSGRSDGLVRVAFRLEPPSF
jgi:hypothetical protein